MVDMRGPEVPQFGLTLSLIARYLRYTGDIAMVARIRGKVAATARILAELHDQALALPASDRGHGLLHGTRQRHAPRSARLHLLWPPRALLRLGRIEDDDADRLDLGFGLPRAWFASGNEIALKQAPTRWGGVDYATRFDAAARQARATVSIDARAGGRFEIIARTT